MHPTALKINQVIRRITNSHVVTIGQHLHHNCVNHKEAPVRDTILKTGEDLSIIRFLSQHNIQLSTLLQLDDCIVVVVELYQIFLLNQNQRFLNARLHLSINLPVSNPRRSYRMQSMSFYLIDYLLDA